MLSGAINIRTFSMVLWFCPVLSSTSQLTLNLLMYGASDAEVWFSPVLCHFWWTLNRIIGLVQAAVWTLMPVLVWFLVLNWTNYHIRQVFRQIMPHWTSKQVWFSHVLNFEPNFGPVLKSSGSTFGSEPDCGITIWCTDHPLVYKRRVHH